MKVSRMVMLAAAFTVAAALPAVAQGRGAAQRPAKVTTAKGPRAGAATRAPKTPNANKPANPGARGTDRAKTDTAAAGGQSGRGNMTIAERIAANPQQKARIEAMLPSGMSLDDAASGFRNQGQFIAAVEASKNQGIAFDVLKTEMTGDNALSLGQAIEKLRPETTTSPTQ